ncbi:hypothetical protein LCGC14_1717000 [marine sediment metagenome]|uniref:DNA-directed DNA polymerase family A palm domain-containing protein n=1 Tax=marine sediment metagenome TaxID=412755 RepID=A0A0F9KDF5_9ZZZZ
MRVVCFDLETHLIEPGRQAPPPVCLSWAHWREDGSVESGLMLAEQGRRWLREQLEDDDILLVNQAICFDLAVAHEHWRELRGLIWRAYDANRITDVSLREKLLDVAEGTLRGGYDSSSGDWKKHKYNLGDMMMRHFDEKLDKGADSWRMRYGELDGVPISEWPERAVHYSIKDAESPLRLHRLQAARAKKIRYTMPTEFEESRASIGLKLTSMWGIRTDGERVQALWDQSETQMWKLQDELIDEGLMKGGKQSDMFGERPKASRNMKAVKERIEKLWPAGLGAIPLTKTGKTSTAKDTVELIHDSGLDKMIEFAAWQKTGSTYVRKLFDGTRWPIHCYYNEIVSSDRVSCSGPNLTNQPRLPGVRECFVSRDGRVYAACDFDAQEMRTLAQSCYDIVGRSKLGDRFNEDPRFDPHQAFADETGGVRQHCKIANFGIPGGMGVKGLIGYAKGYSQSWTPEFAANIKELFFQQWPEMNDYFDHVSSLVGQAGVGYLVIPQSGFKRGLVGYCDAANSYFQTLAAHASKSALYEVCKRMYNEPNSPLYGSRPVAFIHDEVIAEVFEETAHEAALEMEVVMAEAMQRWVPKVPASASATLMKWWSKGAKRVTDSSGRLVPYDLVKEAA